MAGDFSIPKFVSPMARELLQGILTTDPERRLKLKDIRYHGWFRSFNEVSLYPSIGIKIGQHSIPVDETILDQLAHFNENVDESRRYIENNRHNHSITIYYLLLKKQLRNGSSNPFDINSTNFDPQLLKKKD